MEICTLTSIVDEPKQSTAVEAFWLTVRALSKEIAQLALTSYEVTANQSFGSLDVYIDGKAVTPEVFDEGSAFLPKSVLPLNGDLVVALEVKGGDLQRKMIAMPVLVAGEIFSDFADRFAEKYDFLALRRGAAKFLKGKPLACATLGDLIKTDILAVHEENAERAYVEEYARQRAKSENWGQF